ncbi:MAG: hypothetical protein R3A45_13150 [Bdellovibrionota bacterium]
MLQNFFGMASPGLFVKSNFDVNLEQKPLCQKTKRDFVENNDTENMLLSQTWLLESPSGFIKCAFKKSFDRVWVAILTDSKASFFCFSSSISKAVFSESAWYSSACEVDFRGLQPTWGGNAIILFLTLDFCAAMVGTCDS